VNSSIGPPPQKKIQVWSLFQAFGTNLHGLILNRENEVWINLIFFIMNPTEMEITKNKNP
jgi:hypothetical protein